MRILVLGGGGFIGGHLTTKLHREGHYVVPVDIKNEPDYPNEFHRYIRADLRDPYIVNSIMKNIDREPWDEIYQLAADMGGAEYIFSGENDANVMHNSALINLNVAKAVVAYAPTAKLFFSSSACVYCEDPDNPFCHEDSAYPAEPDSAYGWEKLFSENMYAAAQRNYKLDVRVARFHNIFGPKGTWRGGKEKAPAAIMRKIAEASEHDIIDVFGAGTQTRSFLHIDECLEGVLRLMRADKSYPPTNIGSDEMVSINTLVWMVAGIAGKQIKTRHVDGPLGVNGRCSDNRLIQERLGWRPNEALEAGLRKTYPWIEEQVKSWKS